MTGLSPQIFKSYEIFNEICMHCVNLCALNAHVCVRHCCKWGNGGSVCLSRCVHSLCSESVNGVGDELDEICQTVRTVSTVSMVSRQGCRIHLMFGCGATCSFLFGMHIYYLRKEVIVLVTWDLLIMLAGLKFFGMWHSMKVFTIVRVLL